jgi:hypothetical protein
MATRKRSTGKGSGSQVLRNVVTTAVGTDALLDLIEKLGLVDLVVGRIKAKFEDTDVDDLFEEVGAYLKRNPEVLVVSLGAITVATGLVVWLNNRREWDGTERRVHTQAPSRVTTSTGRVRRAAAAAD